MSLDSQNPCNFTRCTINVAGFQANNDQANALVSYTITSPLVSVSHVVMIYAVLLTGFLLPHYNVTMVQNNKLAFSTVVKLQYDLST